MIYTHHLSNYTYFWDHPFLGWATIAGWAAATDGFGRDARSVMVGRELMWIALPWSAAPWCTCWRGGSISGARSQPPR